MKNETAFVEARKVFVEYSEPASFLKRVTGQSTPSQSILRNITFQLALGEWVTLFGDEGAGKTTLLRTLVGIIQPTGGQLTINGRSPQDQKDIAAGYVSSEESEPRQETVNEVLHAFGKTHGIEHLPARIGVVSEVLDLGPLLSRPAAALSSTERLRVNIARAALSDTPLVLFDGTADELGAHNLKKILESLFRHRTVIIATRFVATAEVLDLPLLILHNATLAHVGPREDIANAVACPRVIDVWVEGLRYDLLRQLRQHPGVTEVRLLPSTTFVGQRLRIVLRSARYLPAMYDLVSQAPLIKVEELPASLSDIIAQL